MTGGLLNFVPAHIEINAVAFRQSGEPPSANEICQSPAQTFEVLTSEISLDEFDHIFHWGFVVGRLNSRCPDAGAFSAHLNMFFRSMLSLTAFKHEAGSFSCQPK